MCSGKIRDGLWPDPRILLTCIVYKRPIQLWPGYFLTRPNYIFLTRNTKNWKIWNFWGKFSKPKPKMAFTYIFSSAPVKLYLFKEVEYVWKRLSSSRQFWSVDEHCPSGTSVINVCPLPELFSYGCGSFLHYFDWTAWADVLSPSSHLFLLNLVI